MVHRSLWNRAALRRCCVGHLFFYLATERSVAIGERVLGVFVYEWEQDEKKEEKGMR